VALIKAAQGKPPEAIASAAKLNPFVVRKSASIASKLPFAKLKQLIHDLTILDTRLKRESLDADAVMTTFLLELAV
jgi:DNA polymerase III delta subunit